MQAPGLKVVAPATAGDAKGLLVSAIRDPNPVCYLEHKGLYRHVKGEVPEGEHTVPLGEARVAREGGELSVIAYGSSVPLALQAAEELDEDIEVIDLRTLNPLDTEAILTSVEKTGKVLIAHEATRSCGVGAEVASLVSERAFESLDAPVRRLTAPDVPIPFSPPLEQSVLPQLDDMKEACVSSSPTSTDAIEIVMPQMGVSVAEGTIVEWTKRPGDWVERDETVCLVTTDKVDVEIPSPAAGRLSKILVEPGDTVDVGTPLAALDAGARPGEAHPEEHHEGSEPQRRRRNRSTPRATARPTAPVSTHRLCGEWPTSTPSISRKSTAPGSAGGSASVTSSR